MTSRQRRRPNAKAPKNDDDGKPEEEEQEPLDEQEQERIVASLKKESQEQMDLVHSVFSRVCQAAMFLCLMVGVTTPHDLGCWIHVLGACILHWGAIQVAATAKLDIHDNTSGTSKKIWQTHLPLLAVFVVSLVVLVRHPRSSSWNVSDKDFSHHVGLVVSNLVTMGGAFYLKWDSKSTKQALLDLESSKYRYKSL